MSAKGRGEDVISEENYPTPAWCTRRILEAMRDAHSGIFADASGYHRRNGRSWLEPCAGEGAIVRVLQSDLQDPVIKAGDIRADVPHLDVSEWANSMPFQAWESHTEFVITNPPFSLAPELIAHFLPRCDWLILLLRASFKLVSAGSADKPAHSYRHNMPDEYKLPQRPSFIASEKCKGHNNRDKGCGWAQKVALVAEPTRTCPACAGKVQRSTSDSAEYSWFVWTPERDRSVGLTRVLPDTPLSERNER